jgi:hypothetical protein
VGAHARRDIRADIRRDCLAIDDASRHVASIDTATC